MIKYLLLCFGLFYLTSHSQTNTYETGVIIDSIAVSSDSNDSFALYLPEKFDPSIPSSVIFIFEPAARAKLGIEVFKEVADTYNHILVCSNNSRNGPYERNFEIANKMFKRIFSDFNINKDLVYTAGFSGGSRLAATIAILTKDIQGVIACGAGLLTVSGYRPDENSNFSYIGLIGDEDMNYQELLSTKIFLNELSLNHEILIYEDGHNWPPKFQINRALFWLELQAYKKNLKAADQVLIKKEFDAEYKLADSLTTINPTRGVDEYERLTRNFNTYYNLDSISIKVAEIKSSKAYLDELVLKEKVEKKEEGIIEPFLTKFTKETILARSDDNFAWWKREFKKLDKEYSGQNIYIVKMKKRIRSRLRVLAIEYSDVYLRNNEFKQSLYCNKLLVATNPEHPYWYFRLAQSYARLDDYPQVMTNLKKAKKLGFKQPQAALKALEDPMFDKFKKKKKFIAFKESL